MSNWRPTGQVRPVYLFYLAGATFPNYLKLKNKMLNFNQNYVSCKQIHFYEIYIKILFMFKTSYICEFKFFNMEYVKSKERNLLTDKTLSHLLRVPIFEIEVDFVALSSAVTNPQNSH